MVRKSFVSQSVWAGISHVSAIAGTLLVQIIISRTFGPEGRGIFANAFALAGLLTMLIGTGHEMSNYYFIASGKHKVSEDAGNSLLGFLLSIVVLIVVTFCIMYFRPPFISISNNRIVFLAVMTVPFTWAGLYLYGILGGLGRADLSYARFAITNLSWLLAVIVFCFLFSTRTIEYVFIARSIAALVALVASIFFIKNIHGPLQFSFSLQSFKESMSYGLKHVFSKIANPMMLRVEMLIIPIFYASKSSLGLYAQGIAILDRILALPIVLGFVLVGKVSEDPKKGVEITATLCRFSFMITFLLGLMVMLVAKPLIVFLFKAEFVPAVPLMWIMFFGMIFRSIPRVLQSYFQGIGQPGKVSIAFFISLLVMIIVDIALVNRIGIKGAAIGVLASCFVEFILFAYMFKRLTKTKYSDLCIIKLQDIKLIKKRIEGIILKKIKKVKQDIEY